MLDRETFARLLHIIHIYYEVCCSTHKSSVEPERITLLKSFSKGSEGSRLAEQLKKCLSSADTSSADALNVKKYIKAVCGAIEE